MNRIKRRARVKVLTTCCLKLSPHDIFHFQSVISGNIQVLGIRHGALGGSTPSFKMRMWRSCQGLQMWVNDFTIHRKLGIGCMYWFYSIINYNQILELCIQWASCSQCILVILYCLILVQCFRRWRGIALPSQVYHHLQSDSYTPLMMKARRYAHIFMLNCRVFV